MFVLLGGILSISSIAELKGKRTKNSSLFSLLFIIMTLMLCLRYGQGTDYYPYQLQYERINVSASMFVNSLFHGEIGWYIIMMVFKRLGASFYLFNGIISALMMLEMYKAINRYSPLKCLSLMIMFPTYYMTYMYSAIRQGIVLSLFFAFGLEFIKQKKYFSYYVLVILMTLFHTSALILILIPLLMNLIGKKPGFWIILAFGMTIIFGYTGVLNRIAIRFGVLGYFRVSVSIPAIAVRLLLGYCIIKMQRSIQQYELDENEALLYYIYIVGLIIFIMLSFSGTLSQRITMPMKAVELLLIPMQVKRIKEIQNEGNKISLVRLKIIHGSLLAIPVLIIAVMDYELIKNINSYIIQGNYFDWVNPLNYPYISIFNKERIFDFISHFKI